MTASSTIAAERCDVELLQIQYSHYNEKGRWALDFKGIPHRRSSYLPGPHIPVIQILSGQTKMPILRDAGEMILGSAQIIDHLERKHPTPPLYPADPDQRAEALEIQRWIDDEVGDPLRRAYFVDLLKDPQFTARLISQGAPPLAATAYRWAFAGVQVAMKLSMKLDEAGAAAGREVCARALDRVAEIRNGRDYLVGDGFSVADLAVGSILGPMSFPPGFAGPLPEPRAEAFQTWINRWAGHPTVAWVDELFARHRGRSYEVHV